MIDTLRPYQQNDTENIRAAYRSGANAVLHVSPTASGKTVMFCYITESAYNKGKSILIVTHRKNLLRQTSAKLKENGLRHGIIAAGYPSIRYRIQIASIQTLIRRLDRWEYFDFLIFDECHHIASNTYQKIKDHFVPKGAKIYGCTATPIRLDGYGLGNDFDTMVLGADYDKLIDKGWLSKPTYYYPGHIDLDNIKKSMGDYNRKQLANKFKADRYLIGNTIELYSKKAEYKPAMVFCINIEEAEKTAKQFNEAGYKSIAIHSKMEYQQVYKAIEDLRDGKIHVITSCDMIGEGTDIPRVEVIMKNRPTLSLSLNHQQDGRGLRIYPGKEKCIIIDQVGNCEKHGLIHWPIKWELTKDRFTPQIAAVKTCDYCFAAYPANKKKCPECGQIKLVRKRDMEIEKRDGELKKIDYKKLNEDIEKADSLKELHAIGKKVGYKSGWAYFRWRQKQAKGA
jgi:superfamily II DNA or RNA helicase